LKRPFGRSPICHGVRIFWCTNACEPTKQQGPAAHTQPAHTTVTTSTHNPPIMASLLLLTLSLLPFLPTFWHSGSGGSGSGGSGGVGGSGGGGGRRKPKGTVKSFAARHIPDTLSLLLSLMHHSWHQHLYCHCHHCCFHCGCCFCCCCHCHRVFAAAFS
jgi:hypothetical protein